MIGLFAYTRLTPLLASARRAGIHSKLSISGSLVGIGAPNDPLPSMDDQSSIIGCPENYRSRFPNAVDILEEVLEERLNKEI